MSSEFKWDDEMVKALIYLKLPIPDYAIGNVQKLLDDFKSTQPKEETSPDMKRTHPDEYGKDFSYSLSKPLTERPPIGVMPEYIWKEKRFDELDEAVVRYAGASKEIPQEWLDERYEIHSWLQQRKEKPKPLFVTEDGVELTGGEQIHGVAIQGTCNDTIWTRRFPFDKDRMHSNRKWFADKRKADEYVILNKPCLSVQDVIDLVKWECDGTTNDNPSKWNFINLVSSPQIMINKSKELAKKKNQQS